MMMKKIITITITIQQNFDDDDDNLTHLGLGSRFLGFGFRV
jgi:hypothetical protein